MSDLIRYRLTNSPLGSALRKATLALGFAILPLGCSNDPEIAGKAILTRGAETYVLQTGNEGKESVISNDEWSADCTSYDSLRVEFADKEKHEKRVGFSGISIRAENDVDKLLPDIWNVYVNLDDLVYDGICPIVSKNTHEDPYEADISTAACELFTNNPVTVLLESASFHVKACRSNPED